MATLKRHYDALNSPHRNLGSAPLFVGSGSYALPDKNQLQHWPLHNHQPLAQAIIEDFSSFCTVMAPKSTHNSRTLFRGFVAKKRVNQQQQRTETSTPSFSSPEKWPLGDETFFPRNRASSRRREPFRKVRVHTDPRSGTS